MVGIKVIVNFCKAE